MPKKFTVLIQFNTTRKKFYTFNSKGRSINHIILYSESGEESNEHGENKNIRSSKASALYFIFNIQRNVCGIIFNY